MASDAAGMLDSVKCCCGSPWFELSPYVADGKIGVGAVRLGADGRIVASSGVFVCVVCGEMAPIDMSEAVPTRAYYDEPDEFGALPRPITAETERHLYLVRGVGA